MAKIRLAVLLSGSGTTLENLFEHCASGKLDAEIVAVLASRPDAFGLERARKRNVPALCVERKKYNTSQDKGACSTAFSAEVFEMLAPYKPDLICLAGFMCLLPIPDEFQRRVMNVHPALLP